MAAASPSEAAPADPWTSAMLRGDFAAAWNICDGVLDQRLASRTQCHSWPRHLQFIWNGDPVDGKSVLVRCYHGLGDTIQFVRLLAPLRKRARLVVLWVQPALMEVLDGLEGVDQLLPLHDEAPDAEYEVDVELMELPHVLRLSVADLPGPVPYLHLPTSSIPRSHSPQARQVGIAWRSGDWNADRSIPDRLLTTLASIPNVAWFSLQYNYPAPAFMNDIACRDIRELGGRMRNLDLIISVDTMVAHLAGALALPTWTLLPRQCDWRWMQNRSDSPWYPTMRLIRQRSDENWIDVIEQVAAELRSP